MGLTSRTETLSLLPASWRLNQSILGALTNVQIKVTIHTAGARAVADSELDMTSVYPEMINRCISYVLMRVMDAVKEKETIADVSSVSPSSFALTKG